MGWMLPTPSSYFATSLDRCSYFFEFEIETATAEEGTNPPLFLIPLIPLSPLRPSPSLPSSLITRPQSPFPVAASPQSPFPVSANRPSRIDRQTGPRPRPVAREDSAYLSCRRHSLSRGGIRCWRWGWVIFFFLLLVFFP
jgi:hypothetical protein